MTGPAHYREAERRLREALACTEEQNYLSDWNQRQAQVHATLALADATALSAAMGPEERDEWDRATGRLDDTTTTRGTI